MVAAGLGIQPFDIQRVRDNVGYGLAHCSSSDVTAMQSQMASTLVQAALSQVLQNFFSSSFGGGAANPFGAGLTPPPMFAPPAASVPPPNQALGSPPAGQGLTTNPPGWPANTVETAGGYRIVPEGKDAAWQIFGPNQSPTDKPMTRVWGDPHVDEADGTRWDFTKGSNFRLPDGTLIDVQTTSETGQSVSKALNIVNGSDRVSVSGIDNNTPTLGAKTNDGFSYRARLINENPGRDTFVLGGTAKAADGDNRVQWARERNGRVEGVITGSTQDAQKSYDQTIDANRRFSIDATLRPDPFRQAGAWGNMLRSEVADAAGRLLTGDRLNSEVRQLEVQDWMGRAQGGFQGLPAAGQDQGRATGLQLPPGATAPGGMDPNTAIRLAQVLFSMLFQQMNLSGSLSPLIGQPLIGR